MIFRKRPVCWMAIGFLLIIFVFLLGRSYKEVLNQEDLGNVYLEGEIVDKQYKDSGYGGYWQVTLKRVKVLKDEEDKETELLKQGNVLCDEENKDAVDSKQGNVLCDEENKDAVDSKQGNVLCDEENKDAVDSKQGNVFCDEENKDAVDSKQGNVFCDEENKDAVDSKQGNVFCDEENKDAVDSKQKNDAVLREKSSGRNIEFMEGKYLCQISASEDLQLKIGQQILLEGKYVPWEETANPGQFDSGKYYCSLGILGQFKKCSVLKQGSRYSVFREGMWKFRQEANLFLAEKLGEEDGALISAMLLGEKSGLDEEDKNLYQRNGISHILAISGLHLMLLGMGVFRVLKVILGGNKRVAVTCIMLMSIYCVFTGNSISTIRATIMFALSLIAGVLGRSYDSLSALGLAAIVQLFMNPYVLNNSGFLLSFLAVIGVTFLAPGLQELFGAKGKVTRSLCVSISSSLTTLPILLYNYGTYPWYSVFLNLFILPPMSVLLFLAVMLIILWVPAYLGTGTMAVMGTGLKIAFFLWTKLENMIVCGIKLILKYFEVCCKIFEHAPFQDGYLGKPHIVQVIVYGLLLAVAISGLIKHSLWARKMILLSAVMILTLRINFGAELTILDVGQGDCTVICNGYGNVYISDCGSSSVSKVGKYRLIPFLKYKGYGKIKGVFVSHLDEDHMNGIVELLEMAPKEKIEISYLFLPESVLWIEEDVEIVEELQMLAKQNKTRVVYLKRGDKINDGQMEFLCLHPESSKNKGIFTENRNNQSLVLYMRYRNFDMLLTGDVEKEGETEILEYIDQIGLLKSDSVDSGEGVRANEVAGEGVRANEVAGEGVREDFGNESGVAEESAGGIDVLKVAHHGSSSSSCESFLDAVAPKLSLISCGKNNSYGHPHEGTLERMETVGSEVMLTMDYGAISIKLRNNGKRILVSTWKKNNDIDMEK